MAETIVSSKANKNGQRMQDKSGNIRIYLYNDSGSDISAGDVKKIGYDTTLNCLAAVDLADGAHYNRVIVAAEDIDDGDYGYFYIEGSGITATVADSTYTADEGLKIHDGTVAATGAAMAFNDNEFAICEVGGDTTTSITITLLGREALGST